jgi:signal transduction histidine kinase
MLSTLKNRLTLALLVILFIVGGASLWVGQVGMRLYYEELTQKLNQSIAMYVTAEHKLLEKKLGSRATIEQLAHQAMVINPVVEVYLLAPDGRILSHALEQGAVKRTHVDLDPVHQFLSGKASFPLRGNDPRHLDRDKIFSVSTIGTPEDLQGYLYVILGGKLYDDTQSNLEWSYIRQQTSWAIALIVAASVLIGVLLFQQLTRPLSKLTAKINDFANNELDVPPDNNDIERLHQLFDAMADKISEQFDQLRESDRLRRELISNVSHDLRTPLATIQGYLETLLIKNDTLEEQQRAEYLRTAERSCMRLARLIADLFELSKLESGSTQPEFEQFSIAELMHDTAQEFSLELKQKQLDLKLQIPQHNTQVYADIGLIQRVFENLIRNAIAHTPESGTIEMNFEETPQRVQVTVADSGTGIIDRDIPHIFDRFYQSSEQPQRKSGSSGLGLAIVKRILDLHGCRIEVSSLVDQGTRFQFDLPLQKQAS